MLKIMCVPYGIRQASFPYRLTAISCALRSFAKVCVFFFSSLLSSSLICRLVPLCASNTHNLCRVKYVWKKRYSFLFFKLYCTKNVNSENATTSNDKHIHTRAVPCTLYHCKKCDVTYYYIYLYWNTLPKRFSVMEFSRWSNALHYCVENDCNLPFACSKKFVNIVASVVRSFVRLFIFIIVRVYIVRWWIINVNYRFSVVMLMTDQQHTMNAPSGINSINSV